MSGKDPLGYYACLGVSVDATSNQIKAAYKARAKETHPDANAGQDTTEKFIEVQKAFEVLSDTRRREQYDAVGFTDNLGIVGESDDGRPIDPIRCTKCGAISAQPRFRVNYFVIGLAYWSYKKPVSGIYCEKCDTKQSIISTGFSVICGWWGLFSFFWNFHALYTHLKDHVSIVQDAILQSHQVFYFAQQGNHKLASAIANESLQLIDDALKALKSDDFSASVDEKYLIELKYNIDKYLVSQTYENRAQKIKKRGGINSRKVKWQLVEIFAFLAIVVSIVLLVQYSEREAERQRLVSAGIGGELSKSIADGDAAALDKMKKPMPISGIYGPDSRKFVMNKTLAEFDITNESSKNYLLVLSSEAGNSESIFVRANESVKVGVPLGTYNLRMAIGGQWYGDKVRFGPDTEYYQLNETVEFKQEGDKIWGMTAQLKADEGSSSRSYTKLGADQF